MLTWRICPGWVVTTGTTSVPTHPIFHQRKEKTLRSSNAGTDPPLSLSLYSQCQVSNCSIIPLPCPFHSNKLAMLPFHSLTTLRKSVLLLLVQKLITPQRLIFSMVIFKLGMLPITMELVQRTMYATKGRVFSWSIEGFCDIDSLFGSIILTERCYPCPTEVKCQLIGHQPLLKSLWIIHLPWSFFMG